MWSVRLARHQLARHAQLAAAALIAALIAVNYLVFEHAFGVNYFRWYVENGTVLGLVLATAAVGLNLDAERDLISSRPYNYLLAWMQLVANLFIQTSAILAGPRRRLAGAEAASSSDPSTGAAASAPTAPTEPRAGWLKAAALTFVELLALIIVSIFMGLGLTLLIIFGVIFAMLAWIVVVAPLQYFLYLVCGGPARTFKNAMWTDEGLPKGSLGFVERIPPESDSASSDADNAEPPARGPVTPATDNAGEEEPDDSAFVWQTVYSSRPVTFTTSVAALVLWIVKQFV